MNQPAQKFNRVSRRRRYLINLCCMHDEGSRVFHYVVRIQLWTTRSSIHTKTYERVFTDEYELIETVNPMLPRGSDVRNVISHIESPDGFLYLLYLSSEEASTLGWQE